MLIGIAHPAFGAMGGAEILAARHARYLRDLGHRVKLVTTSFDEGRWAHLSAIADVRVVGKGWFDHFGKPGTHPKVRRRAARQAAALRGSDVVLAENFPANIVAAEVRGVQRAVWYCNEPSRRLYPLETNPTLAARVRASVENDSPLVGYAREQFAKHAAARATSWKIQVEMALDAGAFPRLTRVVTNSWFTAEIMQRVYGRPPDAVIYPTVATVESPPARYAGQLDQAGLRVLTHSRMEPMKNLAMVLRGFHHFSSRHPGAHELHVVGEGPEEATLRALARSLGIESSVHFHGFLPQPELEAVYARCEVMALLPADEPFGMVFPEAAQRGLLIMGPDHGGPLEILEGGALGWPLDIFSPEPLAEAFVEAWRLPASEVLRRRERAAFACRSRYAPEATLPLLLAQIVD